MIHPHRLRNLVDTASSPDGPEVPSGPNKAAFRAVDAIGVPVVTISGRCCEDVATLLVTLNLNPHL